MQGWARVDGAVQGGCDLRARRSAAGAMLFRQRRSLTFFSSFLCPFSLFHLLFRMSSNMYDLLNNDEQHSKKPQHQEGPVRTQRDRERAARASASASARLSLSFFRHLSHHQF